MFSNEIDQLTLRREFVFLILAGLFLGSLTMLNLLAVTKFIDFSDNLEVLLGFKIPFQVPVGVLPYPITFLCTDLISELYGKKRANMVVWIGLMLNGWVLLILWMGDTFPGTESEFNTFSEVKEVAFGTVFASMIAYLTAQFIDVHVFHWLKKKTQGKKLWLRNNVSTLISQLVDTTAVILVTYSNTPHVFTMKEGYSVAENLTIIIASAYVFKLIVALLDTIPFYFAAVGLNKYLKLETK